MNKKFTTLFAITILLTVSFMAAADMVQTADAAKAKGTYTSKYGQATQSKVCGDRLCSESPSVPMKEKMQKQHQDMIAKADTMDKSELIKTIKEMMQNNMQKKIDQLEQMTVYDIRQQMVKMQSKMDKKTMSSMMDMSNMKPAKQLYNPDLNPRQIEYENVLGFNDLHIEAIRHLYPDGDNAQQKLQTIVHHHCKVYDDMTASCLLFPTGMDDQDKPYGFEYIITSNQYNELPDDEKKYWHYHKTELPRAHAAFPDLTAEQLATLQPVLDETYGKVFYFWDIDDKYPIGEPTVLVIQNLPE